MLDLLDSASKPLQLHKGKHLIRQGAEDGNLYIVKSGLLKVYYITSTGKEFVKTFIDHGGYIASISALLGLDTCPFNILAIENTELVKIPKTTILELEHTHPQALAAVNKALLHLVQKKEQREYEFLCLPAEQRYVNFCNEYNNLLPRISQYDIASYLGITPVALSRIKNRKA